jgi:hypothetical protein
VDDRTTYRTAESLLFGAVATDYPIVATTTTTSGKNQDRLGHEKRKKLRACGNGSTIHLLQGLVCVSCEYLILWCLCFADFIFPRRFITNHHHHHSQRLDPATADGTTNCCGRFYLRSTTYCYAMRPHVVLFNHTFRPCPCRRGGSTVSFCLPTMARRSQAFTRTFLWSDNKEWLLLLLSLLLPRKKW